jgi:hypothetical protein
VADRRDQWYWCLDHGRVEPREGCRAEVRMGPYATREEAEHWRERVAQRNEAWDAADDEDT